jgi:hypothetical protein
MAPRKKKEIKVEEVKVEDNKGYQKRTKRDFSSSEDE